MTAPYLCVDVGGTKILIGEVDEQGVVQQVHRYDHCFASQRGTTSLIITYIEHYIKSSSNPLNWKAIGISIFGRSNPYTGEWLQLNAQSVDLIALSDEVSRAFDLPCFVLNDVKSAALAELTWGAGNTLNNFIYVNVGTGLAAATIVEGKLLLGGHYNAGEVGHSHAGISMGLTCGCGRMDCAELYCSGKGVDLLARRLQSQYSSILEVHSDTKKPVSGESIIALAQENDPLCTQVLDVASTVLANVLMNMTRFADPEKIVLGGGLIGNGYLLNLTLPKINPNTVRFVKQGICLTELSPHYMGLLGAAALCKQQIN